MDRNLIQIVVYVAIAFAVAIQVDELGVPLMYGHVTLLAVVIITAFLATVEAGMILGKCLKGMEDDYEPY